MGFVFCSQGREDLKKEERSWEYNACSLSRLKKIIFKYIGQLFLSFKIHVPNTYFIFFEH